MPEDQENKVEYSDQPSLIDDQVYIGEKRSGYSGRFIAYVDLSAKLEQWTKDTAVAISNGASSALWVPKEIKQRARDLLRERHGRQTVRYRLLAILIFLAVEAHLPQIDTLFIDRDYAGAEAEATIKNLLLHLLHQNGYTFGASFIRFANVKGSGADRTARRTYVGKESPPRQVAWEEIMTQMQKLGKATKGHKRRIA